MISKQSSSSSSPSSPSWSSSSLTLQHLADMYAKMYQSFPLYPDAGMSLLTGPGWRSMLSADAIRSQGIENSTLSASLKIISASMASIDVIESPYCVKRIQFRFPRSKKKRIRRKWSKDGRNYKVVPTMFWVDTKKLRSVTFPGATYPSPLPWPLL